MVNFFAQKVINAVFYVVSKAKPLFPEANELPRDVLLTVSLNLNRPVKKTYY